MYRMITKDELKSNSDLIKVGVTIVKSVKLWWSEINLNRLISFLLKLNRILNTSGSLNKNSIIPVSLPNSCQRQ